jgi:hypothetical protein
MEAADESATGSVFLFPVFPLLAPYPAESRTLGFARPWRRAPEGADGVACEAVWAQGLVRDDRRALEPRSAAVR